MKSQKFKNWWSNNIKPIPNGIGWGVVLGIFLFYFIFCFSVDSIFWGQNTPIFLKPFNYFQQKAYSSVAASWQDNDVIKSISYLCSFEKDNYLKVVCIYDFVCQRLNYKDHDLLAVNALNRPETILKKGGVCRDYATLYSSVLNNLNISNKIMVIPNHVYVEVNIDDVNYKLDQCTFKAI